MRPTRKLLLLAAFALLEASSDLPVRLRHQPQLAVAPAMSIPSIKRGAEEVQRQGEELLSARNLVVPVQGVARSRLRDNFDDTRGKGRKHKALDIMAPWGTPVLAADDGRVAKMSRNRAGGLAVYQSAPDGRFVYYYAHLAGYADGLYEGQRLQRGDLIGYVGTTGNAPDSAPHLHFAVQLVAAEGRWWKGEAINPYEALAQGHTVTARP